MKIRHLLTAFLLVLSMTMMAENSRLLRFPSVSENQIAFTYAGDLYSVGIDGGIARKLTSHEGNELFARFSPDGSQLAFTGQYDGNTEVYIMPSEGGQPQRLTYTATLGRDDVADRMGPNNIVMSWSPDGKSIVFRTRKQSFNSFKGQLFSVSPDGNLPVQLPFPEGGFCSFSPDGKKMAYNRVFREFRTWKYYQGGMADEIWVHNFDTHETVAITNHDAQDVFPMWIEDEIFFLSDRDRTMNLFVYNTQTGNIEKVTNFDDYDIKFPSHNGSLIVFEKGGQLFTFETTTRTLKLVPVSIANDQPYARKELKELAENIRSISLSPDGGRALFGARGEVFSVPTDEGITYNHTQSSGAHERGAEYSPDGKWMAWLSDQSGEYEIWIQAADGSDAARQLTSGNTSYIFNIRWSPDSKYLAWNDQLYRLMLTDIEKGESRQVAKSERSRLSDFNWSPDSKWLVFSDAMPNQMSVIKMVSTDGTQLHQVSEAWYDSGSPSFSSDGKYLLFSSQRDFNPTYSRTEWNHAYINTDRIYLLTLSKKTPSPFAPENKDVQPVEKEDKQDDKKEDKKKKDDKEEKDSGTEIDFDGIENRIIALPVQPAYYSSISMTGDKIYYNRFVQGAASGRSLMVYDVKKEKESEIGNYSYTLSPDNKKMLLGSQSKWQLVDLPSGQVKIDQPIDLSGMKTMVAFEAEWTQIFNEAWRQMRDFFYVENMHGVDWNAIHKKYSLLLPHVQHRDDLNYLIGEMIGELNAGHAYVNTGEKPKAKRIKTGLLGAKISADPSGYFKIEEILDGAPWSKQLASPLQQPGADVNEGDYIIAVDRHESNTVENIYKLLVGKAGQTVELLINDRPEKSGARKVLVTPVDDESELYYFKWVNDNIRKVSEATKGEVGYLHIPDMGPNGLNQFVRYFYPQLDKKALIIDDRGNGGGNVSPMILERLAREAYRVNMRRNSPVVSPVPAQTQTGPKVALIDKYSASDGDLFAHGFKALGIGTTIGTRTWGGIVGISGSLPFIDGTDLRIPQFTSLSMEGKWMIEGVGVSPDMVIENDPWKEFNGEDEQLNKAIEVIMEQMKERRDLPSIPDAPVK